MALLVLAACLIIAVSLCLPWQTEYRLDRLTGHSTTLLTMYVWTLKSPNYVLALVLPLVLLIATTVLALSDPQRAIPLKNIGFLSLLGLVLTVSYSISEAWTVGVTNMLYRSSNMLGLDLDIGALLNIGAYIALLLLCAVVGIHRWRTSTR